MNDESPPPLPEPDLTIDALGLLCPLPVLRLRKRLGTLDPGQIACLIADDRAAVIDVPHFCNEQGHELLGSEQDGRVLKFWVRKAP